MQLAPSGDEDIGGLAIIDEAHLTSFTSGDKTLEDELAELFVTTAQGYLKRMREALRDERSWSAEAHALKGASANLGAKRLAEMAKKAEFASPSADQIDAIDQAIGEVEAFFSRRKP